MQKIIQALPILVVIAAIGIITYYLTEERKAKSEPEPGVTVVEKVLPDDLPVSGALTEKDRQFVSQAFHDPETLDATASGEAASATMLAELKPIPMPEISCSDEAIEQNPEQTDPTYFHDAFASLCTDVVRNPDSAQNRATIQTIMQKRQRRLAQEKR